MGLVLFTANSQVVEGRVIGVQDSMQVVEKMHSPHKATLYEALVPGLGHIYNKKAWHIPITYAAFGTTIYFIVTNNKSFKLYKESYNDLSAYVDYRMQEAQYPISLPRPEGERYKEVLNLNYDELSLSRLQGLETSFQNSKNRAKRYRDLSYIILGGLYVLNIIWAAADAHFFNYDVSEDLSINITPQILISHKNQEVLGVQLSFNLKR